MSGPLAYRNGTLIPQAELSVAVTDAGFVQGLTVAEQLRTFGGALFRLPDHMSRLQRSLEIVGVSLPVDWDQLTADAERLVAHNYALLPDGADLGLCIFVTPGPYGAYAAVAEPGPVVAMHTTPLHFASWAAKYDQGQALRIVATRQVPVQCWPAELKCRSRMHYYLADREAAAAEPGARALLLDIDGRVTEASTANIVFHFADRGLVSPPRERILPGISVAALHDLAVAAGVPWQEQDLTAGDVLAADEILLCSTSVCVLPVTTVDGRPIGAGRPGPVCRRLLADWSELAKIDIRGQAMAAMK